ncbi:MULTISPECIES: Na(+)-translocating NADH-quinone reductase subunit C [Pseudoalteromonas]|uniref:Na(+)-translocating NADH-quinone reductase subunit C n=1 Tax=Pseudoalteromonas rubra TaxID=43658 RepID=A0A5S3V5C9_9GAMM|nr:MULTISPECIES: Na(+)-translocating NADH-quinone reductase subunit C [Pseudoalteromonas]KAF7788994.1 Na+-transporting NADH:ubiquinone oxidoreductase subunit C [Pseudoalteromonas rubra]MCG7561864.1 Na(+)-translocating NADH-quinone reductase subunit C [Pseudoalteromonas sp. McH1-42]MEC4088670.1 Na(+)-translocating NADH-quinone reductase subunit C [Pseudoalteromonas rubra]QPB82171.1 Na(+)-translocating NADH-quinone reductase subunit C [Pseudoalteromonas rubra]
MSSNNESIGKTLGVVVGLCLVCAVVVSFAAVQLRPLQQANKIEDVQRNILAAAGVENVENVSETYNQVIDARVVDMKTGEFVDTDPNSFDFTMTKFDAARSVALPKAKDVAGVQRMTTESPVYLAKNSNGKFESVILPIQGYGLWGIMYGFVALDLDGETIQAIKFYQHTETAGLGGEIQNPRWTATWQGKKLPIDVVKGTAGSDVHKVDGLSGATLTSNGVENTFTFWTGDDAFGPFLAKVREGALN